MEELEFKVYEPYMKATFYNKDICLLPEGDSMKAYRAYERTMLSNGEPCIQFDRIRPLVTHIGSMPNHIVMQYTGVKDKVGNKIFRYDIIRYDNGTERVVNYYHASYVLRDFNEHLEDLDMREACMCCYMYDEYYDGIVVGNLYSYDKI